MDIIALVGSIIVALITGGLSLVGVIFASKKQHSSTIAEVQRQNDVQTENFKGQINLIKADINNLEKKQDKHNNLIERMCNVEKSVELLEEKQRVANHRIDDLERRSN